MLKNILKLEGAQQLSRKEQKSLKGGRARIVFPCYCMGSFIGNCYVSDDSSSCCKDMCQEFQNFR